MASSPFLTFSALILQIVCLTVESQNIGYTDILSVAQKNILNAHKLMSASSVLDANNAYTANAIQKAKGILTRHSNNDRNLEAIGNKTVSPRCFNQTLMFFENLINLENWALHMFDSMAKLPSNIYSANLLWLGSYDECVNITTRVHVDLFNNRSRQENIHGRYCRVGIPLINISANPLMGGDFQPGTLVMGLCLPDSCSSDDFLNIVKEGLSLLPISSLPKATVAVCQYDELDYDAGAISSIVILVFIGLVLFLGTAYDLIFIQSSFSPSVYNLPTKPNGDAVTSPNTTDERDDEPVHFKIPNEHAPLLGSEKLPENKHQPGTCGKILLSFSVYTNASKILNTKQSEGSLQAVNGIRVLSMMWVLLGHTYAFSASITENMLPFITNQIQNWTFQAIINATVSVDSFFVLSGLLVAYLVLKEMKRNNGKLNWPMFFFHRFWRLTPCYMLVLMTYETLFRYWDNGPLWPQKGIDLAFCKETWWTNLLYINNFVKTEKMCIGWSWYLSNDMQFYVVSPLMFVPLYFSGIIGGIVCLMFLLVAFITSGVISSYYGMSAMIFDVTGDPSKMLQYFDYYYIKPYCRVGPYVIGIVTGYILYKTGCKVRMSRILNLLGWAVATACALSVLYGLFDSINGHPISTDLAAFYNAVHRTVWAMALCWVVFACATGYGGFVNTILSWNAWIPIGRLTYCGYLIHPMVIFFYYFQRQHVYYISTMEIIYTFFGHLITTYAVSFLVSLAFEAPWMGIEKVIFRRK